MTRTHQNEIQRSESFPVGALLALSGGLLDAYTYVARGGVFANAQTGNIVLMSERLFHGDWAGGLRYLVPLTAFALGVFVAERVRRRCRAWERLHWRQLVVLGEIAMLGLVGFLPDTMNLEANALVSFACAMQVQAFRKVNGYPYASTMCIGNLRSGMEALEGYLHTREKTVLHKALHYFGVVLLFALGAGLGSVVSPAVGTRAIWFCCAGLLVSFALMSLKEQTA